MPYRSIFRLNCDYSPTWKLSDQAPEGTQRKTQQGHEFLLRRHRLGADLAPGEPRAALLIGSRTADKAVQKQQQVTRLLLPAGANLGCSLGMHKQENNSEREFGKLKGRASARTKSYKLAVNKFTLDTRRQQLITTEGALGLHSIAPAVMSSSLPNELS